MQALRIFAHAPARPRLARPRSAPPKLVCLVESSDPEQLACEPHVLDILARAPLTGETIEVAYRRKERELAELFRALDRSAAAILHRRLADPRPTDELAARFARLVVDRRVRLLAILEDAPRRAALR